MSASKTIKCECNSCHRETIHDTLYVKEDRGRAEDEVEDDHGSLIDCGTEWGTNWRVIQCRGCESISMRRDAWHSEATDEQGRPEITTTYFPPRTFRELPEWIRGAVFHQVCPAEINSLMKELYVCLQNGCCGSSAMLTRAVFEHMMIHKTGNQGTFRKNLDAFEHGGFIGKKQREIVESMLEAGHASMHRAFIPKKEDIVTLVDILEGSLEIVYVQTLKADELRKRIPPKK